MSKYIQPETIKYLGSKRKIAPFIHEVVKKTGAESLFDGFSGSTYVSQYFANNGYSVHSNDIAEWSFVLSNAFLLHEKKPEEYEKMITTLNKCKGKNGWFNKNYGGDEFMTGGKRPWRDFNAKKLDSIRDKIDSICLTKDEKYVALSSLVLALDKVDNTLGHYSSYLSEWSPRSLNKLELKVPRLSINNGKHVVTSGDVMEVLGTNNCDIAYFDPPYGSNNNVMPSSRVRYNPYYHIWKTIILNDKPELFGKVNRRQDSRDKEANNRFEEYRKNEEGEFVAVKAIDELIANTPNEYILLSYSSGGKVSKKELTKIFKNNANSYKFYEIQHSQNVMKSMTSTKEFLREEKTTHKEYLILLKK